MGRPAGGNKKRKVTGSSKRAQAQPEPPSKRRAGGAGKPSTDVYEAEDSDPDEVKHSYRYDRVDNYEYEAPSEIEDDEEIDEELAFTAEDKKKYGGWFDEHDEAGGSLDEDDEGASEGLDEVERDSDLDILYSDEELQEGVLTKASKKQGSKRLAAEMDEDDDDDEDEADEDADEAETDEDAELMRQLGDDEEAGEDDENQEGEEDEEEGDDARHRDMLAAVMGANLATKRSNGPLRQMVVSEAYPEAEFALNPGAASAGADGELTLADLLAGLGGEGRKKLPASLRKELDKMSKGTKSQVVPVPLPRVIKERAERTAGYALTSQEVAKWQPLVKANREAPTLQFTSARDEVPRISTTAAIVAQHTAETTMESEVAALLEAAGAASATAVAASEEALSAKSLTVEEARERRGRLARLRSLLFYHELKAKRLKTIKSKEFHRKAAKATKRKGERALLSGAQEVDEDGEAQAAEREEAEAAEFDRAKERLTLKHRNTSRWARRALKRGATIIDEGTKAAVAEQLRLGQALRRRIEGTKGGSSEDDDDDGSGTDSASDGEGGTVVGGGVNGRGMSNRVKALALDILSGPGAQASEEEVPKKGLFALPFMARALERKRQAALQDAQAALTELQEQEELQGSMQQEQQQQQAKTQLQGGAGRRRFGGNAAGDAGDVEMMEDALDSDAEEDIEAKAERLRQQLNGKGVGGVAEVAKTQRGKKSGQAVSRAPTAAEEADLDQALGEDPRFSSMVAPPSQGRSAKRAGKEARAAAAAANVAPIIKAAAVHQPAEAGFIAAKKFQGAKPGMVFTKGPQGIGYYPDKAASTAVSSAAAGQKSKAGNTGAQDAKKQPKGKLALASQAPQAANATQQTTKQPATQPRSNGAEKASALMADLNEDGDGGGSGSEGEEREGMLAVARARAAEQRALVSMAFAGDDVEAEFAVSKAEEVVAELPKIDEPSTLPGWGAWADQQRDPKWMRDAKAKAQRERDKAAAGRADANLQHVILCEKYDRKAMTRYTTPQVPFPFDNRETYERSIRQPLGREYNPDASFRDLIRPAVLKNTGVVIEPIRYSKPMAKHAAEMTSKPSKSKVVTVAGGLVKKAKKPQAQKK